MILKWMDGEGWMVCSPIRFSRGEVPMGFASDGLTLKLKLFHMLVDRQGKALRAAIVHDYCYVEAVESKAYADQEFYRICVKDGVPKWKARLMYIAVAAFGEGNY